MVRKFLKMSENVPQSRLFLIRKFRQMLFHSPLEICGNVNWNFRSNGKRSIKPYLYVNTAKLNSAVFLVLVGTAASRAVKISTFVKVRN